MSDKIYALFSNGSYNNIGEYTLVGRINRFTLERAKGLNTNLAYIQFVVGEAGYLPGKPLGDYIWHILDDITGFGGPADLIVTQFPLFKIIISNL